jgi:DNA-binding NtrC family response regulator
MHDPQVFPAALARIVAQALGAYRVLIMVRIPGLGRQVTFSELSGAEAAGIGEEVLRHIRGPEDHWLAHNAFADPHLRRTSQTVRTFELKSLLAVAIPQGDRAVGALYVDDLYRPGRFGSDDVGLMKRLGAAVGRVLPLLGRDVRGRLLDEPRELLGLVLSDPAHIRDIEYAISMISAERQTNLLITGPTGAGKSVLANRVAVEVLGLDGVETVVLRRGDPQMLVTQLGGAKRGEFTGALTREGAIQRCLRHRRALFLDEVQNLDDVGQQILLPLLEVRGRHFGGLTGSSAALDGPLHVILGTNALTSRGRWKQRFREDLWYRMSAVHIDLPPLVDRGPEAVYRTLSRMLEELHAPAPEEVFEVGALHRVTRWSWPGNLRQLQVFADRAARVHRGTGARLSASDLPRLGMVDEEAEPHGLPAGDGLALDEAVIEHVVRTLEGVGWVQSRAAEELRMSPSRLNKLLKRHGLLDEVKRHRQGGEA